MYHLYMIISLKGAPAIRVERNHIFEIAKADLEPKGDGAKCVIVGGPFTQTFAELLTTAADKNNNGQNFWIYDSELNNCQDAIESVECGRKEWN